MAKQTINVGTSELSGDGESIRSAFVKTNDNFDEVYSDIAALDGSKIVFGDLSVATASASGAGSLSYDNTTGVFTFTPAASGFDGDYNSLTNKPVIPTVPTAVSSFTNDSGYITGYTVTESDVTAHQAALTITQSQITDLSHFSGDYNDLTNKPTIPTVPTTISAFTNDSGYITGYTVTESDVTAHQAALSITESQISDLQSYLTSEQHGNFTLSSNSITTSNGDDGIDLVINGPNSDPTPAFISRKWRFADTGAIQFLDPFLNTTTAEITTAKVGNWDTAYSWGNHASAGYLTSVSGFITDNADDTMSGKLTISNSGTIGQTTPANGYLKITDGSNTLALDPNEIYSTSQIYIKAVSGGVEVIGGLTSDALTVSTTENYSTAVFTSSGHEVNLALDSTSTNGRNYMIVSGGTGGAFIGGRFGIYDADAAAERFGISSTGAIKFNNAFTFPTTDGSNGQVLTTNGSGTLTWQTPEVYVASDTTGITGADQVTNIVSLTQAEYDAIVTPNASTMYVIVG